MAKDITVSKFTDSLKDYLINAASDKHNSAMSNRSKYNNLKVFFNPGKVSDPHFFVSLGMSEACFCLDDGTKIDGAIGVEDGYIAKWSQRTNIKGELEDTWKAIKKKIKEELAEEAQMASDKEYIGNEIEDENKKNEYKEFEEKVDEEYGFEFEGDILGTGINRAKKEILEEKRAFKNYYNLIRGRFN